MANKRYVKGRRFEYRVRDDMLNKGFLVFRVAGSKPVDLIAYKNGKMYAIECKYNKKDINKTSIEKLRRYREKYGVKTLIAYRDGRKIIYKTV